jgi:hypothetical protein
MVAKKKSKKVTKGKSPKAASKFPKDKPPKATSNKKGKTGFALFGKKPSKKRK